MLKPPTRSVSENVEDEKERQEEGGILEGAMRGVGTSLGTGARAHAGRASVQFPDSAGDVLDPAGDVLDRTYAHADSAVDVQSLSPAPGLLRGRPRSSRGRPRSTLRSR